MSGTTCCISLISWTTPHFPVATFTAILFFPQESNLKCRKDLRKALHLVRQWSKRKHVVSFRDNAYLWDKITRVTLKARGAQETLKWGPGKKEKSRWYSVQHASGNREYSSEDSGGLAETHTEGNRVYMRKSFRTKTNSNTMKASRKYRSTLIRCTFRYGRD